jgi:hypothetical protein
VTEKADTGDVVRPFVRTSSRAAIALVAALIAAGAAAFVLVATPEVEASAPKPAVKGDRLDISIRPVRVTPVGGACMQRAWPVHESECRVHHVV